MVLVVLQVRHPVRLIRPAVKDMIAHPAPPVSDASVDLAGVRLAGLPTQCLAVVRDSRQSASAGAPEPQAARRCQELQLLDALPMAVFRRLAQDAGFPQPVSVPELQSELKLVSKVQPQVV